MVGSNLTARWIDSGKEPQEKPNPEYPNGKPMDLSDGARFTCERDLPCPAKRIGYWIVECPDCRQKAAVTTAGRPDDPCSIKLACKTMIFLSGMDDHPSHL